MKKVTATCELCITNMSCLFSWCIISNIILVIPWPAVCFTSKPSARMPRAAGPCKQLDLMYIYEEHAKTNEQVPSRQAVQYATTGV